MNRKAEDLNVTLMYCIVSVCKSLGIFICVCREYIIVSLAFESFSPQGSP